MSEGGQKAEIHPGDRPKEGNPLLDVNKEWEAMTRYLGETERLVQQAVSRADYLAEVSPAVDRDDLCQEARLALFDSWIEKINGSENYLHYLDSLRKYYYLTEEELNSPRIFAGYAKTKMFWAITHSYRQVLGKKGSIKRKGLSWTHTQTDMSVRYGIDDASEQDLFGRMTVQVSAEEPSLDAETIDNFKRLLEVDTLGMDASTLRRILYEEAYLVMEEKEMESAGSGSYRKKLNSAIQNRRAVFMVLIAGEGISLRKMAERENLDYESVKQEARRLPALLFSLSSEIKERIQRRVSESRRSGREEP